MPLDIFTRDLDAARRTRTNEADRLPATFGDTIEASWSNAVLFGQSVARLNARSAALYDHAQSYYDRTGDERLSPDALRMDIAREPVGSQPNSDLARYNARVAQVLKDVPEREASGLPTSRYAGLQPLTDDDLDDLARRKSGEAREAYKAMAAREKTAGGSFGMFAGGAGGALVDPVNVLAFPLAAPEGMGVLATTGIWAAIAGGTQTAIEAAGAPFREQVEPGYLRSGEPFENIAGAAAFGGGFGGSLKLLGNGWRYLKTKEWPRTIRDAGNVVESEAQIADTNPFRGVGGEAAHRDALRETIDNLTEGVTGRPADVGSTVTPEHVADYEKRLTPIMNARRAAIDAGERASFLEREEARLPPTMERLSERQLGEIAEAHEGLGTGLEERTAKLTEQAEKARGAVEKHTAMLQGLRDQRDNLEELVSPAVRVDGKIYRASNHVDALHAAANATGRPFDELVEGLKPGSEGWVTTERELITRADAAKLDRQKTALRDKIAAGEARLYKLAATAEERAAQLPLRTVTAEARAATRQGRTANEMAKAVTRLAEDGYGVKLSADEAKAFGDRIIKAKPDEREVALRETTEALVERSRARRAVAPEMPFGKPRPHEEQRAVATRLTNMLRTRIQTLARESGYAMPRDEAATIAERMKAVKEPDALAILDELGVRPRTLARTLTEPRPEVPADIPSPAERITAAAVQFEDRKYTGVLHSDAKDAAAKAGERVDDPSVRMEEGFLTNTDRFVSRREAVALARNADQLKNKNVVALTAEDLKAEQLVQGLRTEPVNENALAAEMTPPNVAKLATDPEHAATMERDFQRMRAETPDKEIPIGVDKDGNPVTRTVEEAAEEIEQRRLLAEEIKASCGPQPAAEEEASEPKEAKGGR